MYDVFHIRCKSSGCFYFFLEGHSPGSWLLHHVYYIRKIGGSCLGKLHCIILCQFIPRDSSLSTSEWQASRSDLDCPKRDVFKCRNTMGVTEALLWIATQQKKTWNTTGVIEVLLEAQVSFRVPGHLANSAKKKEAGASGGQGIPQQKFPLNLNSTCTEVFLIVYWFK